MIDKDRELPPTATYPKPGQRRYHLKVPGVKVWDIEGRPKDWCMCETLITQEWGSKKDIENYYVEVAKPEEVRNAPRDQFGRPALSGYWFHCTTAEPTPERPGVYLVLCGVDGLPYWCGCLGARGHHQQSTCKHRSVLEDLATNPL